MPRCALPVEAEAGGGGGSERGEQAEAEGLRESGAGVAAGGRAGSSGRADDSWRNLCYSAGRGRGCGWEEGSLEPAVSPEPRWKLTPKQKILNYRWADTGNNLPYYDFHR